MGAINAGRVILGGLVAGLVMNIGQTVLNLAVLGKQSEEAMKRLNVEPPGGGTIGIYVGLTFLVGIALVWGYAAIRPRFGPGPKTAVIAGVFVWLLSRLLPSIIYMVSGMLPGSLVMTAAAWGFVEVLLAALAGGWLYREA